MEVTEKKKKTKCQFIYTKVTNETRKKLLSLVNEKNYLVKDAADELKINYSTAKTILRIWKIEKRICRKYNSNYQLKNNKTKIFKVIGANSENKDNFNKNYTVQNCHNFQIEKAQVKVIPLEVTQLEAISFKSTSENSSAKKISSLDLAQLNLLLENLKKFQNEQHLKRISNNNGQDYLLYSKVMIEVYSLQINLARLVKDMVVNYENIQKMQIYLQNFNESFLLFKILFNNSN